MGVDLQGQPPTAIARWRWRSSNLTSEACRIVTLGQSGDGRWYADHSGLADWFDFDEPGPAVHLVEGWLGDGQDWMPTPGSYDAFGRPDDGLAWAKRGGEWFPA